MAQNVTQIYCSDTERDPYLLEWPIFIGVTQIYSSDPERDRIYCSDPDLL